MALRLSIIGALAAAALSLGGCNMVTSDAPLFGAADSQDAPTMKVGLWISADPDCDFDPNGKRADWPKCVRAYDVGDEGAVHLGKDGEEMRLAGKNPTIIQLTLPKMGQGAPPEMPKVLYVAMAPTAFDDKGHVTEADGWFVLCGPPPQETQAAPEPDTPSNAPLKGLTEHLLPGLTARGENCVATTKAAVRGAAVASRGWNPQAAPTRWLREGKE